MTPTQKRSVQECIVELLDAIGEKAPVTQVEFGYQPLSDGSEPGPGDAVTYWARARLRSGRVRMVEVERTDARIGFLDALVELARELGLSIRIDYRYLGVES